MDILNRWLSRRTLYASLLYSYLLMLLIPLCIELFSYWQYSGMIAKETEEYNLSLLKQSERVLDDRLQSIEEMTINLSLDSQVQRFINVSENMDAVDKYNMSKLIENLDRYKKTNSFIRGIYIYFPKSGSVVTETAKTTVDDFYKNVYRYADWPFEDWKYALHQIHNLEYRAAKLTLSDASAPSDVICLLQSVFQGSIKQPVAAIVVTIDAKKVEQLLSDEASSFRNLHVLDRFGRSIFGIGDRSLLTAVPMDRLAHRQSFEIEVNGEEYLVSGIRSSYRDRQYVSITSTQLVKNDLSRITSRVILVTLCLFAAGIVLAVVLAKLRYRPIKKLADLFRTKVKSAPEGAANELELIEWMADTAFKEKEQFAQAMHRQMPIIRSNTLLSLMRGSTLDDDERALEDIGIEAAYPFFSVILVHIDQYRESKLKERNLSKFVIGNVLEHLGREIGPSFAADIDIDRVGVLINLPENNDAERKKLHDAAAKALEFIGAKFDNTITVSIGGIHDKLDGIHRAYQEAFRAMEYQIVRGYSSVIRFEEMEALQQPRTYVYPMQTEELLIGSIKQGDFAKVRVIMNEVYEMNFAPGNLPLEMARCLFFDMMGTAIKVLGSSALDYDSMFAGGPRPYELLTSSRTIQEMREKLLWIYERICEHIREDKKRHSHQLEDRIAAYIRENFADPELSLTKVAAEFNISPTYLSGFFKEQAGENFLNYVSKIRVEAAKKLLVERSISLQEIAEKVGYSGNVVLIRNFKKLEGMTPGEYREKHSGQA
ncbi:helix-turn-helix domain-containing protein [Paenibacillus hamazuiensis]|uniref:helix-turn-helix domain-containing protein n=1 Tax=Paenibacillus hamazuiensis TaxID=2936508 RepID=UPI002010A678|nr:helix-turn-helix domain-containing protein [Paenibacillus hamazuiensis]